MASRELMASKCHPHRGFWVFLSLLAFLDSRPAALLGSPFPFPVPCWENSREDSCQFCGAIPRAKLGPG